MLSRRPHIYAPFLLACCFALSYSLALEWENRLLPRPGGAPLQRAQAAGGFREMRRDRVEKGTSQRIWQSGDAYNAEYTFINFNRDRTGVSYGMKVPEFRDYMSGYGYTDREMDALRSWKEKAHAAEWDRAYRAGGESAARKAIQDVAMDYDLKVRKLLLQRGFALRKGNVVECDMPNVVKRNTAALKPLALAFQKIASDRGYGAEDTVGAVLSMVQTAIRYQIPPMVENGRHIGGLLPPVKALLSGWGDCDTKTGVAASVLSNWNGIRMVGIAVPGHYLMAIRRIPGKGDMFVRYEGLEYVLVEPAGPAWLPPGTVGADTAALLENSEGYVIEPFL